MSRADEIRHEFLVKHEHADALVFDEESKEPLEARYFSGFKSTQQADAEMKAFFEEVARLQVRE